MKVMVVYTSKSKHVKPVAEAMARWVKTHAISIEEYQDTTEIDLLVLTFDDTLTKDRELHHFVSKLQRKKVRNLVLVNAFYVNNKKMESIISLCHQLDLPLMREQYSWKVTIKQWKQCDQCIIDGARLYVEDMVNIVRNYY